MVDKAWVDVAQFLVNLILAIVTVSLFVQGQRDRRRVDEDRKREQATKVSVLRREIVKQASSSEVWNSWDMLGTIVVIRNDSALPITGVAASTYELPFWDQYDRAFPTRDLVMLKPIPFHAEDELPSSATVLPGDTLDYEGKVPGWHDVMLKFVDAAGVAWVRTSHDGKLWRGDTRPPTLRSKVTQGLCRIPWLGWLAWLIHKGPHDYASWRFRITDSGIPLAARWVRFTWGHVPIGEPDPWLMPWNAPAKEWPYDHWIGVTRRFRQRARRGPCGLSFGASRPDRTPILFGRPGD